MKVQAGVAHYAGLQSCGSIWACPVCSAKIRNTRAEEISGGTAAWDRAGNTVYMITLTMPHDVGMRLGKLLPVIADGFRSVISGRPWLRLKKGLDVAGTIRSVEVTHGDNGWHPHLHVLMYFRGDLDALGLYALDAHVRAKWSKFITGSGYRAPHGDHGVKIVRCYSAAEAGAYIAKTQDGHGVGNELARSDLKRGRGVHRTPFEILDHFGATGDVEDLALWREYERATKGHQAITWSKGLHKLLAVEARTDEEVAAEEVGGEELTRFDTDLWRSITTVPGLPAFILDQAERDGAAGVSAALARHGFRLGTDP